MTHIKLLTKLQQSNLLLKEAQDYDYGYEDYLPMRAMMNDDIYDYLYNLGYLNPDYALQADTDEGNYEYTPEQAADRLELSPEEYDEILKSASDKNGIKLVSGVKQVVDSLGTKEKTASDVSSFLNEIYKIGRANTVIKKMIEDKEMKKTAEEMDKINKDYLVTILSGILL